jgi:hypothetical protein
MDLAATTANQENATVNDTKNLWNHSLLKEGIPSKAR